MNRLRNADISITRMSGVLHLHKSVMFVSDWRLSAVQRIWERTLHMGAPQEWVDKNQTNFPFEGLDVCTVTASHLCCNPRQCWELPPATAQASSATVWIGKACFPKKIVMCICTYARGLDPILFAIVSVGASQPGWSIRNFAVLRAASIIAGGCSHSYTCKIFCMLYFRIITAESFD